MISFIELLNQLKDGGIVPPEKADGLVKRIEEILTYEPRVGIFGKTGVGKSSLCNALFGAEVTEISHVAACTRDPQEIFVQVGAGGIQLIDCPGVGESRERDEEYRQLYKDKLPEFDLVLWLIKADDRAFSTDQQFFDEIVKPNLDDKPLFIVLNQVDKIDPYREWDIEKRLPSLNQQNNIEKKIEDVVKAFSLQRNQVVPVSANEQYNLINLVDRIVFALPKEKKISFAKSVKEEQRSNETKRSAEQVFFEVVGEKIGEMFGEKEIGKIVGKVVDKFLNSMFRSWW